MIERNGGKEAWEELAMLLLDVRRPRWCIL